MALIQATETEIQKSILDYLIGVKHFFCWRNNTGGLNTDTRFIRFGKVGSGDILGLTKEGRFFSIEVKRPGKKPTEDQIEFMNAVAFNNGIAFVATCLEDVFKNLP